MPELNKRNFDLSSFTKASEKMIQTNDRAYDFSGWGARVEKTRDYTPEEISRIIASGSLPEQQKLSRNYFYKDGYYKQIIIYYATLLKYAGLLIPNPSSGKTLSQSNVSKRYYNALDYVEKINLPTFFTNCAQRALVDGSYFGVIIKADKTSFSVLDLPSGYCQSRFKDDQGNDIIEFDISYFDSIPNTEARAAALATYPKVISKAYKKYHSGNTAMRWIMIPTDIGICFPFFDGRPLLLSTILASINYEDSLVSEHDNDAEGVRKIVVQKIPHLTDGRLLFEPDEAAEMHAGSVEMLKGNKNVSVLTTYADVDSIVSSGSKENLDDYLTRIEQNIYAQAGVSGQVFAATGAAALKESLKKDLSLMMYIAHKFENFITNIINRLYSNSNVIFKYVILPISYYNESDYITNSFKLASSGYSFLLPALALDLTQKDISSIKDLENEILDLRNKLIPLSSSYTQSSAESLLNDVGRPEKETEDKAEGTVTVEESLG